MKRLIRRLVLAHASRLVLNINQSVDVGATLRHYWRGLAWRIRRAFGAVR